MPRLDPDSWRARYPDLYGLMMQVGIAADHEAFDLAAIATAWVGGRRGRAALAGRIAQQDVALCAEEGEAARSGLARLANRHLPDRAAADRLVAELAAAVAGGRASRAGRATAPAAAKAPAARPSRG